MKQVWSVFINARWTTWLGYAIAVLPLLYDNWDMLANLIPEDIRLHVYSLLGILVVVFRNRDKIVATFPPKEQ